MMNCLDMKDDSLLLPVRFEVHFEIVSLDKTLDVERFEVHFESNIGYKNDVIRCIVFYIFEVVHKVIPVVFKNVYWYR